MKKEILDEINRLLSGLEQDPHLPSNKEVDETVREVLEHLKGFVGNRRENGKGDSPDAPKIVSEGLEEEVFKEWGTTKEEYLAKSMDKVHLEMEIATYLQDWDDDDEIGLHLSTDNGSIPIELEDIRDLARHFAEWQREQMLKDAMEGEIGYWNQTGLSILLDKSLEKLGYDEDIKVKIIIIKEDKED